MRHASPRRRAAACPRTVGAAVETSEVQLTPEEPENLLAVDEARIAEEASRPLLPEGSLWARDGGGELGWGCAGQKLNVGRGLSRLK